MFPCMDNHLVAYTNWVCYLDHYYNVICDLLLVKILEKLLDLHAFINIHDINFAILCGRGADKNIVSMLFAKLTEIEMYKTMCLFKLWYQP